MSQILISQNTETLRRMPVYEQQVQTVWEIADVNPVFIRLQKKHIINKAKTYASALFI